MGITLAVNWIAIFFCLQVVLFFGMLYTFWSTISKAASKISEDFSIKSLILSLLEALGQGELQDSLVIGFLQYFINTNNDFCRICEKPFKMVDNRPAPGSDDDLKSLGSFQSKIPAASEDVVQINCNPTHFFHSKCLSKKHLCPVCHDF